MNLRLLSNAAMLLVSVGLAGCLDPLVKDKATDSVNLLPRGSEVPDVNTDGDLQRQIRINDGLADNLFMGDPPTALVPLKNGFAKGAPVKYWDLGDAPQTGALMYVLVYHEGDGFGAIEHPWLLDTLPGDPGYSPFHYVQYVPVTERYNGELITSGAALADALELGLVEDPIPQPLFLDGPVVQTGARLATGAGQAPISTVTVYARGFKVDMLPVGGADALRMQARANRLPRADSWRIFVGGAVAAAAEPVFQNPPASWTPAVRVIECRVKPPEPVPVPVPTAAAAPVITDEAQIFTRDMMGNLTTATDKVVTWTITTSFKNWPLYTGAP
jgi:hypothetical protein